MFKILFHLNYSKPTSDSINTYNVSYITTSGKKLTTWAEEWSSQYNSRYSIWKHFLKMVSEKIRFYLQ